MAGAWRDYYREWREVTREYLDPRLLDLVEPLAALAPPALTIDKRRRFSIQIEVTTSAG